MKWLLEKLYALLKQAKENEKNATNKRDWVASDVYEGQANMIDKIIALFPTNSNFPEIICLCGSTKFMEAFQQANLKFTCEGKIILSVGTNTKTDAELTRENYFKDPDIKRRLDELHKRKIDMCDSVFVLNVGGYIGESTRSEIDYANAIGKPVKYLET